MADLDRARRRILTLSTASFALFAGCSDIPRVGEQPSRDGSELLPEESRDGDTDPDRSANQPLDTPAATIRTRSGDTFPLHNLSPYTDWYTYADMEWNYFHPDSRVISVTVSDTTLTVAVEEMQLNRDIRLKARYETRNGSVATTDSLTVSPESDSFQSYDWELSFDGSALPRRQRAVVKVIAQDTHTGDNTEYVFKEHTCAVIPYRNSEGPGRHYLNSEDLNYNLVRDQLEPPERLYTEYIDTDEERTRFFALSYPVGTEGILTSYTNVPHDAYEEYMANRHNNSYRMNHHPNTYAYNADDFEYFTSLADSFAASLDAHGINRHFDRLQQLAYLIGCFTYERANGLHNPQLYTLYNEVGNCTAASTLYLALMNTSAFNNTRGAFVACKLRYRGEWEGHTIIGIDERDLNPPDPDAIYWMEPTQQERDNGMPDTRYAFLELTKPRRIGAFASSDYDLEYFIDSTDLAMHPEFRDF